MNDAVSQQLCKIVAQYGRTVCDDPRRLRALLTDLCPGAKRDIHALMTALQERVVSELLTSSDGLPWDVVAARLARRLEDETAMNPTVARWAVDTWASALGKQPSPKPLPEPPSDPSLPSGRSSFRLRLLIGLASAVVLALLTVGLEISDSAKTGHSPPAAADLIPIGIFVLIGAIGGFVAGTSRVRWSVILAFATMGLVLGAYQLWWWVALHINYGGLFPYANPLQRTLLLILAGASLGFLVLLIGWMLWLLLQVAAAWGCCFSFRQRKRPVTSPANVRIRVVSGLMGCLIMFGFVLGYAGLARSDGTLPPDKYDMMLRDNLIGLLIGLTGGVVAGRSFYRWLILSACCLFGIYDGYSWIRLDFAGEEHFGVSFWFAVLRANVLLGWCAIGAVGLVWSLSACLVTRTAPWRKGGHQGQSAQPRLRWLILDLTLAVLTGGVGLAYVRPHLTPLSEGNSAFQTEGRRPVLEMHTRTPIYGVAYSPDGKRIASASGSILDKPNCVVTVWDSHTGREERVLQGHQREVACVAFSPDGKSLASGAYDATVRVWDVENGEEKFVLSEASAVFAVAYSPDGKHLASASETRDFEGRTLSGALQVWDANSGHSVIRLEGHRYRVTSVAFSPDGRWIATGGDDQKIVIWDAETFQNRRTLASPGRVTGVCFSPDSTRLISSSGEKALQVWDPRDGREILTIGGHKEDIQCVAFHPDGKRIVNGYGQMAIGGGVSVRDLTTGKALFSLASRNSDAGGVNSVAISPDGKRVAVGEGYLGPGRITVWSLE